MKGGWSLASREYAHHRHTHRYPERHLGQDHRLRSVGHRGVDLDAAVHGPRVHDNGVGPGPRELVRGEPVILEVLLLVLSI